MIDKQELKVAMIRYGDKQEDLAAALGITSATLSLKINSEAEFKRNEIEMIIKRYSLSTEDMRRIFFASADSLKETD